MAIGYAIASLSRNAGGTVSVTTSEGHPFLVGDKVRLYNVMGGGAIPFMAGNPYTVLTKNDRGNGFSDSFTYFQTGGTVSANMLTTVSISSGSQYASSTQYVQVVTSSPHNLTTAPRIKISGVTGGDSGLRAMINRTYGDQDVQIIDSSTLVVRLQKAYLLFNPGGTALVWTTGSVEYVPSGAVVAYDDGINALVGNVGGIGITTNQARFYRLRSEGQIIAGVLNLAYRSKGIDYPFLRLFDPSDLTKVSKSALKARISITTAAATLRSAMDSVIEAYQGNDAKKRRYFINPDGQFVYELLDDIQPLYATAPYKIITNAVGAPNASTVAATLNPFDLNVAWDHDTTKRALFRSTSRGGSPIADLVKADSPDALGTAYARAGAPYFDDIVDYPSGTDDRLVLRQQAAKAFMLERYAPILSGTFTLRGSGTASHNNLGFSSGYAQIASVSSATISPGAEIPYPASYSSPNATFSTYPFAHNWVPGMAVVVTGIDSPNDCGTFTIAGTPSTTSFTYVPSATPSPQGTASDSVAATAYALFVRTGTAPNQIVTATFPIPHGIASGAITTVSNLTGTAGSTMNGTATATVVNNYSFTYPSTGTNGTATGTATVSSITLVPRWEPGMWCDITAPELNLQGLYRVEQVDWRLEESSYNQIITITFNRRPSKTLTKLLKEKT